MSIRVFYDKIGFRLKGSGKIKGYLEKVIRDQKMTPGDLNFILTCDDSLIDINRKFLNHDYYTDVISFCYNDGNVLNGEIYISIDTVKENAKRYSVKFNDEVLRVMIHGTLHLCGYVDGSIEERETMNELQNRYIKEFKEKV